MICLKFYIASGLQNRESVQYIASSLINEGFTHTYDWTKNNRASTTDELCSIGQHERDGVVDATFLIVLLPGGKGIHVELGMALAARRKIYLYSLDESIYNINQTVTFYFLPEVETYTGSLDNFLTFVLEREKRKLGQG